MAQDAEKRNGNAGTSSLAKALFLLTGVLVGLGGFTFIYAEGLSYLSTDPEACMNCHIMRPQYDSWLKSSHHTTAACVDCHLPHDFIGKYIAKGENGWHHSVGFTLQSFHEPIMIKPKNARILEENCLRCHGDLTHELMIGTSAREGDLQCVHCHKTVGHGETAGLGGWRD